LQSKDLRNLLSSNVKAYRTELGLSQAELAEKAGISIPFLSAIECCTKWPSAETLTGIAQALGLEAFQLLRPQEQETANIKKIIAKMSVNVDLVLHQTVEAINQCC
jgi:transcriptional regulator with XRE-family HTH domain